jgi:hypothetical protein
LRLPLPTQQQVFDAGGLEHRPQSDFPIGAAKKQKGRRDFHRPFAISESRD